MTLLSVAEVAKRTGETHGLICRLCASGYLTCQRIGLRTYAIPEGEVAKVALRPRAGRRWPVGKNGQVPRVPKARGRKEN